MVNERELVLLLPDVMSYAMIIESRFYVHHAYSITQILECRFCTILCIILLIIMVHKERDACMMLFCITNAPCCNLSHYCLLIFHGISNAQKLTIIEQIEMFYRTKLK